MKPCQYSVVVEGELGPRFVAAFDPYRLETAAGTTAIVGMVRDQAELQGLLDAIAAFGLQLVSVTPEEHGSASRR